MTNYKELATVDDMAKILVLEPFFTLKVMKMNIFNESFLPQLKSEQQEYIKSVLTSECEISEKESSIKQYFFDNLNPKYKKLYVDKHFKY